MTYLCSRILTLRDFLNIEDSYRVRKLLAILYKDKYLRIKLTIFEAIELLAMFSFTISLFGIFPLILYIATNNLIISLIFWFVAVFGLVSGIYNSD